MRASIAVKVQPRASANRVAGRVGEEWKIQLTAPPVEGKANRALIEFLARGLRVPLSAVQIIAGQTNRRKRVAIEGVSPQALEAFLRSAGR